jgi:hypothetical protein
LTQDPFILRKCVVEIKARLFLEFLNMFYRPYVPGMPLAGLGRIFG